MNIQQKIEQEKAKIAEIKKKLRRKIDREPKINGMFRNLESPGIPLEFNFHGVESFRLEDGKVYALPVSVVKHINSLSYPQWEYKEDPATGQLKPDVVKQVNRFAFIPVEEQQDEPEQNKTTG